MEWTPFVLQVQNESEKKEFFFLATQKHDTNIYELTI